MLPAMVYIIIAASLEDLKSKKIRNELLFTGLLTSVILNSVLFLSFPFPLSMYLAHLCISLLISVGLFFFGYWSPGDAKFYFLLSTFIHPLNYFESVIPLLFFAILILIWIFFDALINRSIRLTVKFKKEYLIAASSAFSMNGLGRAGFLVPILILHIARALRINFVFSLLIFLITAAIYPKYALSSVLIAFFFDFFISSLRVKGRMIAAPFIGVSFIIYQILW